MSRIGRMPITVPAGVEVKIGEGNVVTVKGPKGELTAALHPAMILEQEDAQILVKRPDDEPQNRALHGLTRTLLHNMVEGVEKGFSKTLEVNGVGYRVEKKGSDLVMNLGFSHQVIMPEVPGITIDVPNPNQIVISGPDKQKVGQFAAEVREKRPPEPDKGILLPKKDFPCIFIYPIAQKGNFHILRFRHPSYHHTDILRALIRFGQ